MPYDENGNWYDEDGLSPWERAHGGHAYDPDSADNARNVWDERVEEVYRRYPDGTGFTESDADINLFDVNTLPNPPQTPGPTNKPPTITTKPPVTKPPVVTTKPPVAGPGGGGPDLGPLLQTYGGQFKRPEFGVAAKQLMDLIGPTPEFTPRALPTLDTFAPTTGDDVFSDPSFGFRKGIGEKALLNSKAAQGLARTGGTLKDLLDYNQNFATQEFSNIDNRRFRDYSAKNKDTLDLYDRGFESDRAQFEPRLYGWAKKGDLATRAEEKAYDNAFDEFKTDFSMWRTGNEDVFNKLKWASEFGLDAATR